MQFTTTMQTSTTPTPAEASGRCVCGVPVAEHFSPDRRQLTCEAARRRWTRQQAIAASHQRLVIAALAIVVLARRGAQVTVGEPADALTPDERQTVTMTACAAISALERPRRQVARDRGIAAGLKTFLRISGRKREDLGWKLERDLREIALDVLNAHDGALQGYDPITHAEIARAERLDLLPPTAPVRRIVESASQGEGAFVTGRDLGDETDARESEGR